MHNNISNSIIPIFFKKIFPFGIIVFFSSFSLLGRREAGYKNKNKKNVSMYVQVQYIVYKIEL